MTNIQALRDITLCRCCTLSVANGECCETHAETPAPYLLDSGESVTLGILFSEHTCRPGASADVIESAWRDGTLECDCDRVDFSSRPCGMCGDSLAGDRHYGKVWARP